MRAARALVDGVQGEHTYGVNTGFGRFVSAHIPEELGEELQLRLLRSHACGVGEPYPDDVVRAAMLLRANTLAKGFSGAHVSTVELLLECLNRGVLPYVPARGSVGASGDLAPLAHLALPLVGEGHATVDGELLDGADALRRSRPRARAAREQGGALARQRDPVHGVDGLARQCCVPDASPRRRTSRARSRSSRCRGRGRASSRRSTARRPLKGQQDAAANVWRLLDGSAIIESHRWCDKVQDAYSLALRAAGARCVPRPPRLRRGDRGGRAQRRDGQPARARRRRADRVGGELPRPAARVRARRARDGGRGARQHLRAPRRAPRQPCAVRRAAAVPHRGGRAQLRAS